MESMRSGYEITHILIPGYHISGDVVFYEIVVSNKKLRWNLWVRFDTFHCIHLLLTELAEELSLPSSPVILPPFPSKRRKLVQNHLDTDFIEERQILLANYLQKVNKSLIMRHSEVFLSFLTPPPEEVNPVTSPPSSTQYNSSFRKPPSPLTYE